MKKTVLIVPYFGKFPSYFNFFLKTCSFNPDYNWLFFTDDKTEYDFPVNVKVIYTSFDEIKVLFKQKLGSDIVLLRVHKLCDYKVTYGYVFQDWIKDYDYWGHCDIDVIYGNLKHFIEPLYDQGFDKIFSLGHLSLYRNTENINMMFQRPINGYSVYKKVFSSDYGYAFDEWHCPYGGINQIFENSGYSFFKDNMCANLKSSVDYFQLFDYDLKSKSYKSENFYKQIFAWENGDLKKYYINRNTVNIQTYPYIHFHKRNMSVKVDIKEDKFLIVPNKFIQFPQEDITIEIINRYAYKPLLNTQYLKVKYVNLRYRINQFYKKALMWKYNDRQNLYS